MRRAVRPETRRGGNSYILVPPQADSIQLSYGRVE